MEQRHVSAAAAEFVDPTVVRQAYSGKLLPSELMALFRDASWPFATRVIRCGGRVRPLPPSRARLRDVAIRTRAGVYDLVDYVSRNRVAGLVIVRDGELMFEHYEPGSGPAVRWPSMSIAKSVSTTLVGAAVEDGYIRSIDDPLTKYLPSLAATSLRDTPIRHVLQMASGLHWDDEQTSPSSERREMLELQIAQQPGRILGFIGSRPRAGQSGTIWNYSGGDTHLVGALLRAAVGRWLSDYLSEKIWSAYGMEADATWWLESPYGLEVAGCGINATLRDFARFGLFILEDGVIGSKRVLPEGWVRQATTSTVVDGRCVDYGFMWWPVPGRDGSLGDGAFSARGIFGQYIYVNPAQRMVVAVNSARAKPKGAEAIPDNDFFNSVAEALAS